MRTSPSTLRGKLLAAMFTLTILAGCGGGSGKGPGGFGIAVLSPTNSLAIIDPWSRTVKAPVLFHQMGSFGGGLFDVVIAPDGQTTLVTNFGDSTVWFINTADPMNPTTAAKVKLRFFAEDLAMAPDGRFALVTDGSFTPRIAVLDVASRTNITTFEGGNDNYNSCEFTPDARNVLCADYFSMGLHVLSFDPMTGNLSTGTSIPLTSPLPSGAGTLWLRPINVAVSPDGRLAIASVTGDASTSDADAIANYGFPVLHIDGPGLVTLAGVVKPQVPCTLGCQSIVFNADGTKAYAHCTWNALNEDGTLSYHPQTILVPLTIDPVSREVTAGTTIAVPGRHGTSQLFGVDTMATFGNDLWVSNPTLSGATEALEVLDMNTNAFVKTIPFESQITYRPDPDPACPTGIAFWP